MCVAWPRRAAAGCRNSFPSGPKASCPIRKHGWHRKTNDYLLALHGHAAPPRRRPARRALWRSNIAPKPGAKPLASYEGLFDEAGLAGAALGLNASALAVQHGDSANAARWGERSPPRSPRRTPPTPYAVFARQAAPARVAGNSTRIRPWASPTRWRDRVGGRHGVGYLRAALGGRRSVYQWRAFGWWALPAFPWASARSASSGTATPVRPAVHSDG